jgi:hypothetical protein
MNQSIAGGQAIARLIFYPEDDVIRFSESSVHIRDTSLLSKTSLEIGRLIIYPEDGDNTFLRNIGSRTEYTALYRRRWQEFINTAERISNLILNRAARRELLR